SGAMSFDALFQRTRGRRPLGHQPLSIAECLPRGRPFTAEAHEALLGRRDLRGQSRRFLARLAELHAHLLAALEQTLELALHLLNGLPEVTEAMLTRLNRVVLHGLAAGEYRDAATQAIGVQTELRDLRFEGR